ncbi:hypothetical protein NDU88_000684 [Pleurodeles waltl]|uniref:Uncharacterized protein n=1 Tax=Pleurodeles waltl TaxID=8319 RepID=A0AAV7L950_PLEWA|nr:hypothetical protein NDU88_000684 [Pleurodeles waltl]
MEDSAWNQEEGPGPPYHLSLISGCEVRTPTVPPLAPFWAWSVWRPLCLVFGGSQLRPGDETRGAERGAFGRRGTLQRGAAGEVGEGC